MIGDFRYIGIYLDGLIQEVVMNKKIHFLSFLKTFFLKITLKLHIGMVTSI